MKRFFGFTLALALASGMALAQPRIVINEFAYDDTGADDLEFIELYNADTVAVDITGWIVDCGDQLTGDNNRDFVIGDDDGDGTPDRQVILQPGQFYVLGTSNLNARCGGCVNQIFDPGTAGVLENDNEWIALIIPGDPRTVVDAVAYEVNRAPNLSTWVPADIIPQLGGGLWGNYQSLEAGASTDDAFMTIGRWRDGYDTNVNGRDFGHFRPTPGASNNLPALTSRLCLNFDNYNVGDAPAEFTGSYRNPRIVDPTQGDRTVSTGFNPNAIPASPSGGKAMMVYDWAGGGNVAIANYVFENGTAGYDLQIYINPAAPPSTRVETWMIGLLGSPESVHNHPLIAASANGMSGVGWVFRRSFGRTDHPDESKLYLVDAGATGSFSSWTVYGSIDLSSLSAGWYRLRLEVMSDGQVKGLFYGDPSNPIAITGTTATGLVGGFYIGYRETLGNAIADVNPVRVDNVCLYLPVQGDVNADGCVDDADLLSVLFAFGGSNAEADVNSDGVVDDADLLIVLFNFGAGC